MAAFWQVLAVDGQPSGDRLVGFDEPARSPPRHIPLFLLDNMSTIEIRPKPESAFRAGTTD
jgi:hypothetical protein